MNAQELFDRYLELSPREQMKVQDEVTAAVFGILCAEDTMEDNDIHIDYDTSASLTRSAVRNAMRRYINA